MLTNGLRVALIEYHNSGQGYNQYTNPYSAARRSFYASPGNPDSYFDGVQRQYGGYPSPQSLYPLFLNKYNARQGILSDFTIQKTIYQVSGNDYMAHITVNKVGSPTSTNMKLLVVFTESHKLHSWGSGLTEVNHICRLIAPDAQGTVLDFGTGTSLTFNIPFTLDASWVVANLEMDVFVQDFSTKEVLQGTVIPFSTALNITEEIKNNFNLNVYPNPLNNTALIAFDLKESSNAMVEVYDIVGKNVYSSNLGTVPAGVNTVDFDGSKLDAGMYIVKLTVNNQVVTKKININK